MLSFRLQLCFLLANLSLATEIKPQSLRKSPPYAKHKRETFREKNVFVVGNPSNEARNHKATEKTKNLYSFASNWNCLEGINNVDSSCADNGLHLPEKNISRIYNSTINQRDTYYISAFLPFSAQVSETRNLQSIWCSFHQAVRYVNKKILKNSQLCLKAIDTECNSAFVIQSLFEQISRQPNTTAVIGPFCYNVTRPLARTAQWWNIIQLSFNINDIELSNDELYRNFVRTIPSFSTELIAVTDFIRHHNWTVIDVIYSSSQTWVENYNQFLSISEDSQLRIGTATRYTSTSADETQLLELSKSPNNIKLFMGSAKEARRVFCKIYSSFPNLSRKSKVWILSGKFDNTSWWKVNSDTCSQDQIKSALQGHIRVGVTRTKWSTQSECWKYSSYSTAGVEKYLRNALEESRITFPIEIQRAKHHAQEKVSPKKFQYQEVTYADFAYDTVVALALAIKSAFEIGPRKYDFLLNQSFLSYQARNHLILNALEQIRFRGKTEMISFSRGERIGVIFFDQFQDEEYIPIGQTYNNELNVSENLIIWPERNSPPSATTQRRYQIVYLSPYSVYFIISLSVVGTCFACAFIVFNITYRNVRIIKMSSPYLNNIIGAGCILAYVSLILAGLETRYVQPALNSILCKVRLWLVSLAFTLAFGTMFLKTWRIHEIFTNVTLKTVKLKDYKLFCVLACFLSVDAAILTAWLIVNPVNRRLTNSSEENVLTNETVSMILQTEQCRSDNMFWWIGAICVYKGILLVFGLFLAWETRQVTIPHLNDSTYIGISVYVTVVSCVIGSATSFALKYYNNLSFIFTSFSIYICTTAVLCLVFLPNIIAVKLRQRRPKSFSSPRLLMKINDRSPKTPRRKGSGKRICSALQCNNESFHQLKKETDRLEELLQKKEALFRRRARCGDSRTTARHVIEVSVVLTSEFYTEDITTSQDDIL